MSSKIFNFLFLPKVKYPKQDNIYCTCLFTNKIMRCDKNGDNVQVYKMEQVKGPGYVGVAALQ